ncbi:hypothetical protein ABW19_dt0209739 [Dactylella cylindrospora]|nr:hypothetical protein ABW19_dt0209739 [Dactylella cylindrospora]
MHDMLMEIARESMKSRRRERRGIMEVGLYGGGGVGLGIRGGRRRERTREMTREMTRERTSEREREEEIEAEVGVDQEVDTNMDDAYSDDDVAGGGVGGSSGTVAWTQSPPRSPPRSHPTPHFGGTQLSLEIPLDGEVHPPPKERRPPPPPPPLFPPHPRNRQVSKTLSPRIQDVADPIDDATTASESESYSQSLIHSLERGTRKKKTVDYRLYVPESQHNISEFSQITIPQDEEEEDETYEETPATGLDEGDELADELPTKKKRRPQRESAKKIKDYYSWGNYIHGDSSTSVTPEKGKGKGKAKEGVVVELDRELELEMESGWEDGLQAEMTSWGVYKDMKNRRSPSVELRGSSAEIPGAAASVREGASAKKPIKLK